MAVTIEWDGIFGDGTIPIQDLIDEVFGSQEAFNARIVRLLPLYGGESGSAVLRAIVKSPHSPIPYVLKCGAADIIARERRSHTRWSGNTTLWQGAPPRFTVDPVIERNGGSWSAILYQLAGNTGAAEDLSSLEETVSAYTAHPDTSPTGPNWASTFNALTRTLSTAYETEPQNLPAKQVLAIPTRELHATLSSVAATAGEPGEGWHGVLDALEQWENYVANLHRDVRGAVCHGDLRGANVLLDGSTHHPFLIDFGGVGINSPIMDLARLEIDLLVRAGALDDESIPSTHQTLFDHYLDPAWETSTLPVLRVIHALRKAFERVTQQGLDVGRLSDEVRFFHACRVSTAARMLRWADRSVTSPQARRHLLWIILEGPRRIVPRVAVPRSRPPGHPSIEPADNHVLRPMPRTPGPVVRQAAVVGISAIHHPGDWPTRNAAKRRLLDSADDLWLLAHSGWSYLAPEGSLFASFQARARRRREDGRGRTRVLLMSPYTEEGVLRAIQQAPAARRFEELETTRTFTRFARCLTDFENLFQQPDPDPSVELRVVRHSIGYSLLLAGTTMFYEPYNLGLASRRDVQLQVFPELEFHGAKAEPYLSTASEQFAWFWDRALSIPEYRTQEPGLREQAVRHFELLTVTADG